MADKDTELSDNVELAYCRTKYYVSNSIMVA